MQHHSQYRATVGAAELQHFSPVTSEAAADTLPEEGCVEVIVTSDDQESRLASNLRLDAVITADFSSNLWFRPPPRA